MVLLSDAGLDARRASSFRKGEEKIPPPLLTYFSDEKTSLVDPMESFMSQLRKAAQPPVRQVESFDPVPWLTAQPERPPAAVTYSQPERPPTAVAYGVWPPQLPPQAPAMPFLQHKRTRDDFQSRPFLGPNPERGRGGGSGRGGGRSRGGPSSSSQGGPSRGNYSRGGPSRGDSSRGGPSRGGPSRGGRSRGDSSRGGASSRGGRGSRRGGSPFTRGHYSREDPSAVRFAGKRGGFLIGEALGLSESEVESFQKNFTCFVEAHRPRVEEHVRTYNFQKQLDGRAHHDPEFLKQLLLGVLKRSSLETKLKSLDLADDKGDAKAVCAALSHMIHGKARNWDLQRETLTQQPVQKKTKKQPAPTSVAAKTPQERESASSSSSSSSDDDDDDASETSGRILLRQPALLPRPTAAAPQFLSRERLPPDVLAAAAAAGVTITAHQRPARPEQPQDLLAVARAAGLLSLDPPATTREDKEKPDEEEKPRRGRITILCGDDDSDSSISSKDDDDEDD